MSTNPLRILIVDDNKDHQHLMKESIEESIKDVCIEFSDTGKDCLFKLSEETYSILIIVFSLSETSGLKLFRNVIQNKIDIPVIMVTGFGNENVAVEAMKLGAYDYIVKSDAYLEKLSATILKVVKEHGLRKEKKEIERKLIESELRYRTLIEDVIDIVFMMDKELNIVSINPACQRIFECSKEDAMKGNLYKLIYETEREMVIDYFKRSFLSKRELIEAFEFRIRTERGNIKHVEMNAKVNYGRGDDVIQIEGVIRDITERKMKEDEIHKLSSAIEQSPVSVIITDTKGNIEYVNRKFMEITGYTSEEVIGKNPRVLKSDETTSEEYKELWETITSGNIWHGEFHNKKKDGELYLEYASISPIKNRDGKITHFVAVKE
ncbi:hypothetical protein LCGC14_1412670, partial [marine sediment metagenome]